MDKLEGLSLEEAIVNARRNQPAFANVGVSLKEIEERLIESRSRSSESNGAPPIRGFKGSLRTEAFSGLEESSGLCEAILQGYLEARARSRMDSCYDLPEHD